MAGPVKHLFPAKFYLHRRPVTHCPTRAQRYDTLRSTSVVRVRSLFSIETGRSTNNSTLQWPCDTTIPPGSAIALTSALHFDGSVKEIAPAFAMLTFARAFERNLLQPNRGGKESMKIGDTAPDFEAETSQGRIRFHDWIGDSWVILFSHPKDFTPVCTTELGYMAKIKPEFDRRNVKIIGLSVDSTGDHQGWAKDIEETQGHAPNYPIIGDADFKVSKLYGMLPADVAGDAKKRTPADNATVRNVYVIGPDKRIKLILVYPMTTGRNFDEVVRVIDSLQLTAKHQVATPVNWKPGEDVIIAGSVSDDEAKKRYPQGWKAPKPYIRIVPQPQ